MDYKTVKPSVSVLDREWKLMNRTPIFLLNGTLSLVAAYFFRRSGYLAAATVHTAADFVWHVLWGLLR